MSRLILTPEILGKLTKTFGPISSIVPSNHSWRTLLIDDIYFVPVAEISQLKAPNHYSRVLKYDKFRPIVVEHLEHGKSLPADMDIKYDTFAHIVKRELGVHIYDCIHRDDIGKVYNLIKNHESVREEFLKKITNWNLQNLDSEDPYVYNELWKRKFAKYM